jgi:hypothetical protein
MVKMRVHLLAKELSIETKELIAQLDKMGLRGRKAQSALEDDEVARIRAALAAQEKPQVHVGEEKVVADRMVKAEEVQGGAEARETVVERRVRANVIRRRTSRVEVAPVEPKPTAAAEPPLTAAVEEPHAQVEPETPATPVEEIPVVTVSEGEIAIETTSEPVESIGESPPERRSRYRSFHRRGNPDGTGTGAATDSGSNANIAGRNAARRAHPRSDRS